MNKTYTIITDEKWKTMQNDGGSYVNVYYEINVSSFMVYKIEEGKFGYGRYYGKINSLEVNSIDLTYYQDTKGYFVPVYRFNVLINNMPDNIFIKAMK